MAVPISEEDFIIILGVSVRLSIEERAVSDRLQYAIRVDDLFLVKRGRVQKKTLAVVVIG